MKKISLLLVACCFIFLSFAQVKPKVNQCGIIIPPKSLVENFQSNYEAENVINTIADTVNFRQNFTVQDQEGINNAYATIIKGKRYIIYDNSFLENLDSYAGTKWASISVMAHEMGHHYLGHVFDGAGSTPPKEIAADEFSGFVMAKLGASLQESEAAMNKISPEQASATHPGKADRIAAITKGWKRANKLVDNGTPPPATPQSVPSTPSNTDNSWIHLAVYNTTAATVLISDDGKKFESVEVKTDQPFIFKFEIYNYGYMKLSNDPKAKIYKLLHSHDYAIIWSRRSNNWVVVDVP